jgi:hypothetical protein
MNTLRRKVVVASITAACLMGLGLLLLGLPGAILLELPSWLGLTGSIEGDAAWPAAILVSIVWPVFIPLGVIAKHRLASRGAGTLSHVALWGTILVGAAAVVTLAHVAYRST